MDELKNKAIAALEEQKKALVSLEKAIAYISDMEKLSSNKTEPAQNNEEKKLHIRKFRRNRDICLGIWCASLEKMQKLSDAYSIIRNNTWVNDDETACIYAQAHDGKFEFFVHASRLDVPWDIEPKNLDFNENSNSNYNEIIADFKTIVRFFNLNNSPKILPEIPHYWARLFYTIKNHPQNCGINASFEAEVKKIFKLHLVDSFVPISITDEELYETIKYQIDIILLNAKPTKEKQSKTWSIKNWMKK